MAVIEATGLQQVLSLSNVAEKVQQNNQHRPDQTQHNFATTLKLEDQLKKAEIPLSNKSDESQLREEYTDKGNIKYKNRPRKRKNKEDIEEEEENEVVRPGEGKIVDIIV